MNPDAIARKSLQSSLDRLARTGDRHLRGCGIPAGQRTRAAALALYDRQLNLHDRLVTADEFMSNGRSDGFFEAAVDDATGFVVGAEQAQLERHELEKAMRERRLKWEIAVAVTLLLLSALLWLLNRDSALTPGAAPPAALIIAPASQRKSSRGDIQARDDPGQSNLNALDKTSRTPAATAPAVVSPGRAEASLPEASPSEGGGAAAAKHSQTSSSSKGSASDKATANEGEFDEKGSGQSSRAASDAAGSESELMSEPQKQVNKMSGNDSDARDSANKEQQTVAANNRPAVSSDRSLAQSESEAIQKGEQKGGSASPGPQTSQKDARKNDGQGQSANPGSSSNASQGDGNSSKDALKKSRGVASMILGVPIPDRVRGLSNPGLVRIAQKKTVPRKQQAAAVDAESRGKRLSPIGVVERPQLRPWQKDLVRDYFSRDSSSAGEP